MSEYPWWFISAVGAAVAAFIRFMVGVYRLAFGDSVVKGGYSDDRRAKEDEAIAKTLAFYTKESARLKVESAKYAAKLEPEIQCEGCGYFHNLRRCPKCRRDKPIRLLYAPLDGGKPEWISIDGVRQSSGWMNG